MRPVCVLSVCAILTLSISVPFPYTTLFRSGLVLLQLHDRLAGADTRAMRRAPHADHVPVVVLHLALVGDRKSTRLNSSHLVISYAVFCLQKKTTELYHRVTAR